MAESLVDSWRLLADLMAIPRTLLGRGFELSLERLRQDLDLCVDSVDSGVRCGSWEVPPEWVLHRAQLMTMNGAVLVDGVLSPQALWSYSDSFEGVVDRETLVSKHVATAAAEDAVPFVVTYYKRRWGFSLSQRQLRTLNEKQYRVSIDAEFRPGRLTLGHAFLPGQSEQTILIDAVLSCGALANNLTGVAAAVEIYRAMRSRANRHYSYLFLFTPETLGPIALAHHFSSLTRKVVGGVNLQNLADRGESFTFKRSRPGNTVVDKAFVHALKLSRNSHTVSDYDVRTGECGNEKAYNSLGIQLPVSAFRRTQLGKYPEYDTDRDNLEFVSGESFAEAVRFLVMAFGILEENRVYQHTFKGEPFLSGYGLFPKVEKDEDRLPYDYLMGFCDGKQDLIDLAERSGLPLGAFQEPARLMVEKGLLK